jgi:hypothetical protein
MRSGVVIGTIAVLVILIVVACVVGGGGKTVEGATGLSCLAMATNCDKKCGQEHKRSKGDPCGSCCSELLDACRRGQTFSADSFSLAAANCIKKYHYEPPTAAETQLKYDEITWHHP